MYAANSANSANVANTVLTDTTTNTALETDQKYINASVINDNISYGGAATVTKCLSKSNERITVVGKKRVVYLGPRGGKYVKLKGIYVPVAKLLKRA